MRRSNSTAVTISKEDDMTDIQDAPVAGLDTRRIGEMVAKLPAIAAYLRHESIEGTLEYVHALPSDRECQFVRDFLTLPLDALLDKWYGGRFHAAELAAGVMDSVVQELRR
jgi:hypothetical protein